MVTSSILETNPSRLPVGTWYLGPPDKATAVRVARVMMSAHDTVEGHADSRFSFTSSIRSNPRTKSFVSDSFSALLDVVEFIRMDASQPCSSKLTKLFVNYFSCELLLVQIAWLCKK